MRSETNNDSSDQQQKRSSRIPSVRNLRQIRLTSAPRRTSTQPSNQGSSLHGMSDMEVVTNLNKWMKDVHPKTAIIFSNAINFISYFEPDALPHMGVVLEDWSKLANNQNICIFIFSASAIQHLRNLIERQQWYFLLNKMFHEDNTPTSEMISIGSPRQDEVCSVLHYWRLKKNLQTDWQAFQSSVTPITQELCRKSDSLNSLNHRLQNCSELNRQILADLSGRTEQVPPLERLKQMRGLDIVAERIEEIIARHQEKKSVSEPVNSNSKTDTVSRLLPAPPTEVKNIDLHIALKGSPGTGKTETARLIGEIYRDAGLLELGHLVEVQREDLVEDHVGGTALKTSQKINDAMGGVLFVDEAYRLTEDEENAGFGKEAVETVMRAMLDHSGRLAVIIAGYPEKIDNFIKVNPGLTSRFGESNILTIPDYGSDILQHIFEQLIAKQEPPRQLDNDFKEKLPDFFANWYANRDAENFGNARDVEKLYKSIDDRRIKRLRGQPDNSNRYMLISDDIPEHLRKHLRPQYPENPDEILCILNDLVGLQSVKEDVRSLVNSIKVKKLRGDDNQLIPGHYLFAGNPGTGKTTVARLMGRIFKSLGLLKKGDLIEVGRADLVGQYLGETAQKTRAVLERSMDNVLFIDEAYQLVTDDRDSFGKEALGTLLTEMENHRDRLCIIFAGYQSDMQQLIGSNPGLASRINKNIIFEDYTPAELLTIFIHMAKERNLTMGQGTEDRLSEILQASQNNSDFGNGRGVRNLLDATFSRLNDRIVESGITDPNLLNCIEKEDLPNA
ncbi:MAG: AAA family ATPase [Desulfobacterales bacterium]|nr:AAA family ATPase [Desulfobacterales bacterium]